MVRRCSAKDSQKNNCVKVSFSIKLLAAGSFNKIRPQCKYFSVNLVKFFKTPFSKNTSQTTVFEWHSSMKFYTIVDFQDSLWKNSTIRLFFQQFYEKNLFCSCVASDKSMVFTNIISTRCRRTKSLCFFCRNRSWSI